MSKRYIQLIKNQAKVKVIARAYDSAGENIVWLATLAAAGLAATFYFFSFFFSFTGGWRALPED